MLVQKSAVEKFGVCIGRVLHYHSTREAMLLHNLLHENWGGCVGRVEHYRSTGEAMLVQQTTIGGLGRLC